MSRSRKKSILKDKPDTRYYHRTVRRVQKSDVNKLNSLRIEELLNGEHEEYIRSKEEIVNDWDYIDWKFNCEHEECNEEIKIKLSRK